MTEAAAPLAVSADLPPEPYPGLRPFERDEWAIFFGREPMIDTVIERLLERQIVVVHGTSGCGKSSLIRAGVLPRLSIEYAGSNQVWRASAMRPADQPLRNLAGALDDLLGPPSGAEISRTSETWHDLLVTGRALEAIRKRLGEPQVRLCLLIDQFEEVFRHLRDGGHAEVMLFADLLRQLETSRVPGLYVIVTLRSEYLGLCAKFEGFAGTVDRCQYLLPRMDSLALLRAIHEPARLFGGSIAGEVGDRLLFAAQKEEDALPIMQHTLMRACAFARERQGADQGWTVTVADIVKAEGSSGALSTHADEILGQLTQLDRRLTRTVEWLFRSLSDVDGEGNIVRRPCRFNELVAIAGGDDALMRKAIEAFRASGCSFLIPPAVGPTLTLQGDDLIDVSHEALLRRWQKLSDRARDPVSGQSIGWIHREVEDGQRWRALAVQAQTFNEDRRATLSPATTAAYTSWWPTHRPAWAARYAAPGRPADSEYKDVERLWQASLRAAGRERWISALFVGPFSACFALLLVVVAVQASPILSTMLYGGAGGAVGAALSTILFCLRPDSARRDATYATLRDVLSVLGGAVVGGVAAQIVRQGIFVFASPDFANNLVTGGRFAILCGELGCFLAMYLVLYLQRAAALRLPFTRSWPA